MIKLCLSVLLPLCLAGPAQDPENDLAIGEGLRSFPGAVMVQWTLPARDGRGGDAKILIERMMLYLEAHPEITFLRLAGYQRYAPSDRGRILGWGDSSTDWFKVYMGFESQDLAQHSVSSLRKEEGWLALEETVEDVFVLEEIETNLLFPVEFDVTKVDRSRPFQVERTVRTVYEGHERALQLAARQTADVNEHYDDVFIALWSGELEDRGVVHWLMNFESSSAWREFTAKLRADEQYMALGDGIEGLFVEGSVREVAAVQWW
jgi:hypothetical protein